LRARVTAAGARAIFALDGGALTANTFSVVF